MDVAQGKKKTILTDYVMHSFPLMPHAVDRVARSVDRHVLLLLLQRTLLRAKKGCSMTSQSY